MLQDYLQLNCTMTRVTKAYYIMHIFCLEYKKQAHTHTHTHMRAHTHTHTLLAHINVFSETKLKTKALAAQE